MSTPNCNMLMEYCNTIRGRCLSWQRETGRLAYVEEGAWTFGS